MPPALSKAKLDTDNKTYLFNQRKFKLIDNKALKGNRKGKI